MHDRMDTTMCTVLQNLRDGGAVVDQAQILHLRNAARRFHFSALSVVVPTGHGQHDVALVDAFGGVGDGQTIQFPQHHGVALRH